MHRHLGHGAPYGAVLSLTLGAAYNWRALRYKIQTCGIPDPMTLPSLHSLLDHFEQLALESFDHDDAGKRKHDDYVSGLYRPDPPLTAVPPVKGVKVKRPAPEGFDSAETFKSFAAFAAAL